MLVRYDFAPAQSSEQFVSCDFGVAERRRVQLDCHICVPFFPIPVFPIPASRSSESCRWPGRSGSDIGWVSINAALASSIGSTGYCMLSELLIVFPSSASVPAQRPSAGARFEYFGIGAKLNAGLDFGPIPTSRFGRQRDQPASRGGRNPISAARPKMTIYAKKYRGIRSTDAWTRHHALSTAKAMVSAFRGRLNVRLYPRQGLCVNPLEVEKSTAETGTPRTNLRKVKP
jgi:hypothetical protein